MAQSDNHHQLMVTLLMIVCMMCYLLTWSALDTQNTVRNFGKKKGYSVHKYRQLRYTREAVVGEEVEELFPIVADAVEVTGSKVTDIAGPGREKGRSQNLQLKKETDITLIEDSQSIFIEEFLDNIFDTENMTDQGIYYTEDISDGAELMDYNLIEMFLDLILMVKIEESLNITHLASPSTPTFVKVLTTPTTITTVNPSKISLVTTMLRPTPASVSFHSFSSTEHSHEKLILNTFSSKLVPFTTTTPPSPTISTTAPSSTSTTIVTTPRASPAENQLQPEPNKPRTGTKSTMAATPAFPIYKAIPMVPEYQFHSLSKPESKSSSGRMKDELGSRASESGRSTKILANNEGKLLVDSSRGSTADLYKKTVDLIKELTNDEVPEDLLDFLRNNHKQVKMSGGKARIPNFRHKQFSKYYQNLDVKMKSSNLPETSQKNILSALRQQLTASVLGNKRLRLKANHLPAYQPLVKIDKNTFKSYYKSKILKMMKNASPLPSQVQIKLQQELQESLADQFGNVQAQLQTKKEREGNAKKMLDEELKRSLKKQLREVLHQK